MGRRRPSGARGWGLVRGRLLTCTCFFFVVRSLHVRLQAFCESCFNARFEFCHFCSEAILSAEHGVLVKHASGKRPYHQRCYQCVVCLRLNDPEEKLYAGEDDENLYCHRHFVWKYFAHCPTCREPVVDDGSSSGSGSDAASVTVNEVEYHRQCALCFVCRRDLNQPGLQVFTRRVPVRGDHTPCASDAEPSHNSSESPSQSAVASPFAISSDVADGGSTTQILLCADHQHVEPASADVCAK